jgi:hypothetical protein
MRRVELARSMETSIAEMRSNLKSARVRVISEVVNNKVNLAKLRNDVVVAMTSFMERREDDHPDIETILETVTRLGNDSVDPGGGMGVGSTGHNQPTQLPDPSLPPLPSMPSTTM